MVRSGEVQSVVYNSHVLIRGRSSLVVPSRGSTQGRVPLNLEVYGIKGVHHHIQHHALFLNKYIHTLFIRVLRTSGQVHTHFQVLSMGRSLLMHSPEE